MVLCGRLVCPANRSWPQHGISPLSLFVFFSFFFLLFFLLLLFFFSFPLFPFSASSIVFTRIHEFIVCFLVCFCCLGFANQVLLFGSDAGALVNFVPTTTLDVYWITFDAVKTVFYWTCLVNALCHGQGHVRNVWLLGDLFSVVCVGALILLVFVLQRWAAVAYASFNAACYTVSLLGDTLIGTNAFVFL